MPRPYFLCQSLALRDYWVTVTSWKSPRNLTLVSSCKAIPSYVVCWCNLLPGPPTYWSLAVFSISIIISAVIYSDLQNTTQLYTQKLPLEKGISKYGCQSSWWVDGGSSQWNFLHTILSLIFTGTAIASVIRNTHSRTEILHQRYSILAVKVNELDILDPGGEVDPIASWIITMLHSI